MLMGGAGRSGRRSRACRSSWPATDSTWFANHVIFVGARLDGANPAPVAGKHYARSDLDKPLASDTDAWSALQLWVLALAFAVTATVGLVAVWNRRAVYLAMAPVPTALVWCVYENAAVTTCRWPWRRAR